MKKRAGKIILILSVIIFFIIFSYYSAKYAETLKSISLIKGVFGEFIYILIMMAAVIIAPFETLPLLPVAVNIWGPNLAAIFSIIGWAIGALIAFGLARRFGQKFVCRFTAKCDIDEWQEMLPRQNVFWLIVLARIVLPVDIVSYGVGLFTKMNWALYLAATLIGIIPFAFIFAHGSTLPVSMQIIAGVIILVIIILGYKKFRQQFKRWSH